jgi:hypothetical protein
MIVGFNAATSKGLNVWDYWSDERGLDRREFLAAYRQRRNIKGVRARLERIVSQIPTSTIETNIYAVPTARAHKLSRRQRVSTAFEFLFQEIRPKIVFTHSTAAIDFLRRRCETPEISSTPVEVVWQGHRFYLLGRPGPLFRASYEEALQIGSSLATLLGNL